MVDRAADAFELAGDDVLDDVAGDVDRVRAEPADDAVGDAELGGQDEELVVALEPVHLDDLDVVVADVEAGAEDALDADHDVVRELGAEDDELVEAGAAVDRDGRVDVVRDLVLAAARADVERPAGREAEADDRAGDAVRVERDRVVLPLRRVGGCREGLGARDVRVGLVADAVAVVVPAVVARCVAPALAVVPGVCAARHDTASLALRLGRS